MTIPVAGNTPEALANSVAAAASIAPFVETARERVFDFIESSRDFGATDREIQERLGMNPNTERPRRVELWEANRICVKRTPDGEQVFRRIDREGKRALKATIYVAGPEKRCEHCGSVYTKTFSKG
jgi:hypothetical protein